jgi:hypothetical protein
MQMFPLAVNQLRKWISCGIVLGLLAAGHVLPAAEVQFFAREESQIIASQSSSANHQEFPPPQQSSAVPAAHSSVSLAPAVVLVRCKFGQSYTQTLRLINQTQQEFVFEMVAQDVVVRDGKRGFVPAGETPRGIAETAVFSQKLVVVKPGQSAMVGVTFTVPPETSLRAAVALFRGLNKVSNGGPVMMTASLGALFTFTVSENFQLEGAAVAVSAQSATANLGFTQVLTNTGSEPVIAGGVAALLNVTGTLVGKATFEEQRLLPGEQLSFRAEYPAELKTGRYRVIASFQYEEKVITDSRDFTVP